MSPITSSCEVSTVFTGGGPSSAGAAVSINGQQLIPSPFINITLEKYKVDNIIIGGVMKLQLNGTAVGDSFDQVVKTSPGTSIDDVLQIGKNSDCVDVVVQCSEEFINGKGRVVSVNANEGRQPNWVNLAAYTIEIEIYENRGAPVVDRDTTNTYQYSNIGDCELKDISEQFTLSVQEDSINWDEVLGVSDVNFSKAGNKHVKVNFSLSATGLTGGCTASNKKYGLEAAETVILDRIEELKSMDLNPLGADKPATLISVFDEYAGGASYLDFRSIEINALENRISVSGEIIYRPSGCNPSDVFTTVTVDETVDNDGLSISISGNIKGLVDINYINAIRSGEYFNSCSDQGRMSAATSFLNHFNNEDVLKTIANTHKTRDRITDTCSSTSQSNNPCPSISPVPSGSAGADLCDLRLTSSQIARNYGEGQINFTFVLSNKNNCSIYGARKVDVEITDDLPRDNIVEIIIPGRGDAGVVIQNLCCKSARKRTININAALTTNLCNYKSDNATINQLKACAEALLKDLEQNSGVDVSCWFVTEDQESLGNTTYRRNKQYVKPSCP